MSDVTVRAARLEDAPTLAQMARQSFMETFAPHNTAENMAAYLPVAFGPDIQAREIADPQARTFVAEAGKTLIGYARLRNGDAPDCVTGMRPVELHRLYVLAAYIGRGVGAALMRRCLEVARSDGHDVCWLGVWSQNPLAQSFYLKWNFERVGEHIFQFGDDPQEDWLMQRNL